MNRQRLHAGTNQTRPCWRCGRTVDLDITAEEAARWNAGELVQNIFPGWPAARRELLTSGIDGACWDELFGEPA